MALYRAFMQETSPTRSKEPGRPSQGVLHTLSGSGDSDQRRDGVDGGGWGGPVKEPVSRSDSDQH